MEGRYSEASAGHKDIGCELDQFLGTLMKKIGLASCPALINPHVAAVSPAELLESLSKRRDTDRRFRVVCGKMHKHADSPHPLALLRPRSERPRGGRAAQKAD